MYRVLIADDEQIVIDSLKYIIERNFHDIEIAATARSGREAVEKVEAVVPDIIFMDIKMPGINGIEAIREIKDRCRHTVFIILTAFEQFDFAKEALQLGVAEYLLKPVNRSKIIDAVKKAVDIVKTDREKRKLELELKEKLGNIIPMLESGFICSLIFFDDNGKELLNYRQLFEIKENGGYVMTVEFGDAGKNGSLDNKIGYSIRSHDFYPLFREVMESMCKCIVSPVLLNRLIIFVPMETSSDEYEQRLETLNIAESLYKRLSDKIEGDFKIGIGRICSSFETLTASYEESLKAIHYLEGCGVMHFTDIPAENTLKADYPSHCEKNLLQKVALGDTAASLAEFNQIFDWLTGEYGAGSLKTKNKLLELIFLIRRITWEYTGDNSFENTDCLEEMLKLDNLSELRQWCRKFIESSEGSINTWHDCKIGVIARKARDYIDEHYASALTLEEVSREVNVSPQYFSKLFKEETGENFIDYLTGIRIKLARNLLEENELSVKEICYKTGYGDPNYFSRIFKRVTGITPTDYRGMISNEKASTFK